MPMFSPLQAFNLNPQKKLTYDERIKVFPTEHPMVKNKDGSVSNVILSGEDILTPDGKYAYTVAFPTMVGGKNYTKEQAFEIAKKQGLDKYPKFNSVKEMNDWAKENHGNIDKQGYLVKTKPSTSEMIMKAIKLIPSFRK
jgi:hypothetical protein